MQNSKRTFPNWHLLLYADLRPVEQHNSDINSRVILGTYRTKVLPAFTISLIYQVLPFLLPCCTFKIRNFKQLNSPLFVNLAISAFCFHYFLPIICKWLAFFQKDWLRQLKSLKFRFFFFCFPSTNCTAVCIAKPPQAPFLFLHILNYFL